MNVFFIENDELLEKCNGIWNKVSNGIKKELDCKPIHNKKFLKTKIRSHGDENTDFNNKEILKVGSNCTCSSVIPVDFVLKKKKTIIRKCF